MKGLFVGSLHKGRVTEFVGGFGHKFKLQGLNNKKKRKINSVCDRVEESKAYDNDRAGEFALAVRRVASLDNLARCRASKYSMLVDPDGESILTGDLIL